MDPTLASGILNVQSQRLMIRTRNDDKNGMKGILIRSILRFHNAQCWMELYHVY